MTMPQEPPQPPPVDPGNQLLTETPAQLSLAHVDTPGGKRLALTVRTCSTTLTVLLSREDANSWADGIKAAAGQMSGLIVAGPGAMPAPPVNGNGTLVAG